MAPSVVPSIVHTSYLRRTYVVTKRRQHLLSFQPVQPSGPPNFDLRIAVHTYHRSF